MCKKVLELRSIINYPSFEEKNNKIDHIHDVLESFENEKTLWAIKVYANV